MMPKLPNFQKFLLENEDSVKFVGLPNGSFFVGKPGQSHEMIYRLANIQGNFETDQQINMHGWLNMPFDGKYMGVSFYSYVNNRETVSEVLQSMLKKGILNDPCIISPEPMESGAPSQSGTIDKFLQPNKPVKKVMRGQAEIERDRFGSELRKGGFNPSAVNRARTHQDYILPPDSSENPARYREGIEAILSLFESIQNIESIVQNLKGFYSGSVPEQLMANQIYHYLTGHEDRSQLISKTIRTNPEKYKQYNETYKNIVQQLSNHLQSQGWTFESNGAWIEWYRNGKRNAQKVDGQTPKRYISVNNDDVWDVLKSLPVLAKNLLNVKTDPNHDLVGFKVPTNFGAFFSHRDNICIHFYDPNAKQQVDQAVKDFFAKIGKQEGDRGSRTTFGADAQGNSDTMLVANQVVRNLKHNQNVLQNMMQNPAQLKQTLQQMIDKISMNASHR